MKGRSRYVFTNQRLAPSARFLNPSWPLTAPCVTAPASAATFPPTMQVPRRTPLSLSLGSLGGMNTHVFKTAFTVFAFALAMLGCGKRDGTATAIPGTYRGSYLGCSEQIILSSSGHFTQTLSYSSASFTNTGSWKYELRRAQDKVVFDRFLVAVDTANSASFNPPKMFGFYDGDWVAERKRIEFRVESGYFVERRDP
jgi:hypothetical protein